MAQWRPLLPFLLLALQHAFADLGDDDSFAMFQRKFVIHDEEGSLVKEGAREPFEAQVVTALVNFTAAVDPCPDCAETGFFTFMRGKYVGFSFHAFKRTTSLMGLGPTRVGLLPWSPRAGVLHNITLVARSCNVHTFILTDGDNPARVFRFDFANEKFHASTEREYKKWAVWEVSDARNNANKVKNGNGKCTGDATSASGQHCVYVPPGELVYTVYPMSEAYALEQGAVPQICTAFGDPHFRTYAQQRFDFMGTGTYTVSSVAAPSAGEHLLQAFFCPMTAEGKVHHSLAATAGLALRVGASVATLVRGVLKVDGAVVSGDVDAQAGGLRLRLVGGNLTLQGPVSGEDFLQVRAEARHVSHPAMGFTLQMLDVYVQAPAATAELASGLCAGPGDHRVADAQVLFDAADLAALNAACCPPEGCDSSAATEMRRAAMAVPSWQEVCAQCVPPVQEADARDACIGNSEEEACLLDFCAACGDPDAVPNVGRQDYPKPALPPPQDPPLATAPAAPATTTTTTMTTPTTTVLMAAGTNAPPVTETTEPPRTASESPPVTALPPTMATQPPVGAPAPTTTAAMTTAADVPPGTSTQAPSWSERPPARAFPGAAGDPHCRNVRGESFDVHAQGNLTFVRAPRRGPKKLLVKALVLPVWVAQPCAPTVIKELEISGSWLGGDGGRLVMTPGPDGWPALSPPGWRDFLTKGEDPKLVSMTHKDAKILALTLKEHKVTIWVNQRQGEHTGVRYLDFRVHGLEGLGGEAGGLLGLDSHQHEASPAPGCEEQGALRLHGLRGEKEGSAGGLLSSAWAL